MVQDVTYVIAGCLVVHHISDDRSRPTFGSPLFLYIAISLAVKCQEIYTNVKNVKLNGALMNVFFFTAVLIRFIDEMFFLLRIFIQNVVYLINLSKR